MNFNNKYQNFRSFNNVKFANRNVLKGIRINNSRYRFNRFFTSANNRRPTLLYFPNVNFIDSITIDTEVSRWPELKEAFTKLLNQNFNKAEINEFDVIKGNMKYKFKLNEIKTHKKAEIYKSLILQALLPADLSYLALAYDYLFLLDDKLASKFKFDEMTEIKDTLERKKLLASITQEVKRDPMIMEKYKMWLQKVAKELRALNYSKYIRSGYKRYNLKAMASSLADNLENLDVHMNYDKKLSKSRLKIGTGRGIWMEYYTIPCYLACINKSLLLLKYTDGDLYFPNGYLWFLRFLNLIPTTLLIYGARILDPPFEIYLYLC
jgi:hypothetical protein